MRREWQTKLLAVATLTAPLGLAGEQIIHVPHPPLRDIFGHLIGTYWGDYSAGVGSGLAVISAMTIARAFGANERIVGIAGVAAAGVTIGLAISNEWQGIPPIGTPNLWDLLAFAGGLSATALLFHEFLRQSRHR